MLLTILAKAQGTSSFSTYQHKINICVGSSMWGILSNTLIKGNLVDKAYATPVFHAAYGYEVFDNVFLGPGLSYQFFHFSLFPLDSSHNALVTNINRLNINLHSEWYVVRQHNFNIFVGGQLGITFWSGELTFNQLIDYVKKIIPFDNLTNSIIDAYAPSNKKFFDYGISKQLYVGVNKYFSPNIGLHGELALGAPYWTEIGLTYRFGQK